MSKKGQYVSNCKCMYIFLCFGWENHDALHLIRWNGKQLCSLYLLVSSMISTILIFFPIFFPPLTHFYSYINISFFNNQHSHMRISDWQQHSRKKKYTLDIFESTFFKIDSFFLSSLKLKNATFQTSLSAVCKNKCSSSYKIFFFLTCFLYLLIWQIWPQVQKRFCLFVLL